MKGIVAMGAMALMLASCGGSKWEYKVVKIAGVEGARGVYSAMSFNDPSGQLNALGEEGWEVVSSYTEENTVHPNFGNAEYVTGLQPNTRTAVVNFVLKRKK
jgi:hypothetical protein